MTDPRRTTTNGEARRVGDALNVDWDQIDLEQFRRGLDVELEREAAAKRESEATRTGRVD